MNKVKLARTIYSSMHYENKRRIFSFKSSFFSRGKKIKLDGSLLCQLKK